MHREDDTTYRSIEVMNNFDCSEPLLIVEKAWITDEQWKYLGLPDPDDPCHCGAEALSICSKGGAELRLAKVSKSRLSPVVIVAKELQDR